MGTDFDTARSELRREPVAPFHPWRLARPVAATIREADNDLHNGWVREADREVIELAAPYPWTDDADPVVAADEMHAWTMLDAPLVGHSATGSWSYLEAAVELVEDWSDRGAGSARAWEPRSTAARAHRLAYVVHAAAVADALDMSRWRPLARLAERHADRLGDAASGPEMLFAAIAHRSLVLRLGAHLDLGDVAPDGIASAAAEASDREGVLMSQSTADHMAVAAALAAADLDDPDHDLSDIRKPPEDALAWLITTDGQPANFGATALEPVNGRWRGVDVAIQELIEPFVSDVLQYALSAGAAGLPPTRDTRTIEGADLAVIKPVWPRRPEEHGPYVAMSRSTGAFVWHDNGRALIVEPGTTAGALAGGQASRVERAVEWMASGAASNALSIEPQLQQATSTSRVGTVNEATYVDVAIEAEAARHRRTLAVGPGRWLLVVDWFQSDSPHLVTQRFLLGPELDAMEEGGRYLVTSGASPVMWASTIHGDADRTGVLRGGRAPGEVAWWAPRPGRIAPASQVGWSKQGTHLLLATLFSLAGPPVVEPAREWSFAFSVDGWTTRIALGDAGLSDLQETPS